MKENNTRQYSGMLNARQSIDGDYSDLSPI